MEKTKKPLDRRMLAFYAILAVFCAASSFAHPVTPTLIVERHLDSSMFGIALAAMMTVNFLFAPFWGKMCGYVPTKRLMLIGCIGYSIGQAIFGAATSEAMVVGGRAFAGIFTSAIFTACSNYIVNTSTPEEKGSNLTVYATVQNVSFAVGFFIGGMLGIISVEAAFIAQVALLALSGIVFYAVCVDDTPLKHKPDHPLTLSEANPFAAFLDIRNFITPSLAMIFVIIAICAIGQNSYEQVFNYYIKDFFGMSSAYNGIFKAAIAIGGMIINSTLCMYLMKKTDTNRSFVWVVMLNTVPIALAMLFFNSLWPFAICDIAFFVINTARLPLMQNLCAMRATPETSNSVMGFYQAMNSLGGIFGAAFAGLIYDTDPHIPFILCFVTFVIGSLLSLKYASGYKKSQKQG
ncbi:MAG: MFS transporter [Firmicutes bacterium]|nr:MFS transporter [Bacillota bacterium]